MAKKNQKILSASEISEADFEKNVAADTISSNLQKGKVGKYAKWMLHLYKNKKLKLEDLYKAQEYLPIFEKLSKTNIEGLCVIKYLR
ncbi:hypothetical protein FACS1894199_03150 [Bacteroidia bacterium]|nr:hypothetical protein FACS1894199_03150 [Bacteroidia bacterium]